MNKVEPDNSINMLITPNVLSILRKEKLNLNHYFILICINTSNTDLINIYDQNSTNLEVLINEYQYLVLHGYLKQEVKDKFFIFEISDKGKELLERVSEGGTKEKFTNFNDLSRKYLELFPKIKLPSGKYARSLISEIEKKLKNWVKVNKPIFKKEYGIEITEELILETTKRYVERYQKDGYKFMMTSSFFIQKNDKSALAEEILGNKESIEPINSTNITSM